MKKFGDRRVRPSVSSCAYESTDFITPSGLFTHPCEMSWTPREYKRPALIKSSPISTANDFGIEAAATRLSWFEPSGQTAIIAA